MKFFHRDGHRGPCRCLGVSGKLRPKACKGKRKNDRIFHDYAPHPIEIGQQTSWRDVVTSASDPCQKQTSG